MCQEFSELSTVAQECRYVFVAAGLLALLDDIATVLDDVAVMSKVAARKSAAVADRMPNLPRECRKAMWRKPMKGVFIRRLLVPPPAGGVVAGQGLARARRGGGRKRYRKAKNVS